ncbi:unnamed protein product [Vitrella brassicaformis CCMP3155]|uniref:60S ribosomal export protein NMD3 n=1 Tax=Vitrella brassicaformis (strain CCMP3155) TaxID=1169540 RepID=A0A0G4EXZ8_VITBC|nr:unnamed protein product [Vitrella brassicaformis CCMP3155]|eukprot:CEM03290.1 unnamed protein product [Vitrella brassicaformis CCMP3155]
MPTVLCCLCGTSIEANPAMMCVSCLRSQVDITEGISRTGLLPYCKECDRYLRPPWLHCELESKELLAVCLKKIKGLNTKGVKLVDASFIWTEPHSRRIKVKCVVQKEVMNGAILQQSVVIEFVVQSQKCEDCHRIYTPHTWNALVQVRQRTDHKRTFLFLEQLIIKHDAHEKVLHIVEKPDGIDFQFMGKQHAQKLADFINSFFPMRSKSSKQLTSHDSKSNTYNYKYTIFQEICPICKDDLVYLPGKLAAALGGVPQLMLCRKVSSSIHLIDPFTLRTVEIPSVKYWQSPFQAIFTRRHLTEFVILDVDTTDASRQHAPPAAAPAPAATPANNRKNRRGNQSANTNATRGAKFVVCEAEVARACDFGKNDERVTVKTHLGHILKAGDYCLGYDLRTINVSGIDTELTEGQMPSEVVLVRKFYPRKENQRRMWTLMHLPMEKDAGEAEEGERGGRRMEVDTRARDLEDFKREIEEDVDMRQDINLYRDPRYQPEQCTDEAAVADECEFPEIQLAELMEGLTLDDKGQLDATARLESPTAAAGQSEEGGGMADDEDEEVQDGADDEMAPAAGDGAGTSSRKSGKKRRTRRGGGR